MSLHTLHPPRSTHHLPSFHPNTKSIHPHTLSQQHKQRKMVLSSSWILSLKVMFMSTGVLTLAMFFKLSVPLLMDFSASRAPLLWSSFLSWLKPPYLYLVINGIIITIVASSRFYQNNEVSALSSLRDADYDEIKLKADLARMVYERQQSQSVEVEEEREETKATVFAEKSVLVSRTVEDGCRDATWKPPERMESSEIPSENDLSEEKPPVSARFGHRKPVKASPEGGRALRVTKPKRQETLESTWKTITEGRAMPLTRHLRKSDTWENHSRHINVDPSPVKKSETFKDRTNYQLPSLSNNNSPASSGKLRKEPSLSQDELNRRVEAFIKKFNEEMRLQRQESLKQYQEMISRGL